jgi:hypothetical protein
LVPTKKRPSTQDDEIRTKDSWTLKKRRIVLDDTIESIVSCKTIRPITSNRVVKNLREVKNTEEKK